MLKPGKNLAIIFNVCGLSGRENANQYVQFVDSIFAQEFDGAKVFISGCKSSEHTKQLLNTCFGGHLSYNWIEDVLPVNVTFNHTVKKAVKEFGDFGGYLYLDSGISFQTIHDLANLYKVYETGKYGMVAAQTTSDDGYHLWWGVGKNVYDRSENYKLFEKGDFEIPLGKTVNLHCQIFSGKMYETYNGLMPDIFAGYCTESVFSYMCAAIQSKFAVAKDVIVNHIHSMDIGSAGFSPLKWQQEGKVTWNHPFIIDDLMPRIEGGKEYGLGYERLQGIQDHDPTKFDEHEYALDHRLAGYIRDNLFLSQDLFDYDKINHTWIPNG